MADLKILYLHSEGYPAEVNPAGTDVLVTPDLKVTGDVDLQSTGKVVGVNAATADGNALVFGQSGANLSGLDIDTSPLTMNSQKITGLGTPTASGDAATKDYVDQQVISGGTVKEPLFSEHQLDDTEGINALEVIYFGNQPSAGDTVIVKNGTVTETYTFVVNQGAESAPTDVSRETSAVTAMQRLVTRLNANSAVWHAEFETGHPDINADGIVEIIDLTTDVSPSVARIYGTWTTQADFKVLEFATGTTTITVRPYYYKTTATASTTDPGYQRFGLNRADTALTDGEIHLTLDTDNQWSWNGDDTSWYLMSGPGSIPDATSASGGGVKGKVTFDSDKGLVVVTGIAAVALMPSDGLMFHPTADADKGKIKIKIPGTNPGLTVGANGLDVKTDGSHGVITGASGVELELASADRLSVGASGLDVVGLPTLFKINGTAVSANVTAPNLDELTGGGSTTLHSHAGSTASERISHTYTAAGAISKADPVYISAADTVTKAVANDTIAKAFAVGVALLAISDTATGTIVEEGVAAGIFSGQTAGARYFVGATGGLTTSAPGAGNHVMQMGFAKNATDFLVQKQYMGKRP